MSVGSASRFLHLGKLWVVTRGHVKEEEEGATLVQREHSDVLDIFYLNLHTAPEEGGGFKAWCFTL